jgi:hypothetical protein
LTGKSEGGQLRVTAAVPGLVNKEQNRLGLQQLARAFAGVAEPNTVDGLMIQYTPGIAGAQPVRRYTSDAVRLTGTYSPQTGLEYRVTLTDQARDHIIIPEGNDPVPAAQPAKPAPEPRSNLLIYIIIVVAALALGALVYSLLLRPKPRERSR